MVKIILVIVIKEKCKKLFLNFALGIPIGIVNGLFGAGGGMLAVPLLKKVGMEQKSAHANAVAVILPITVISAVMYLLRGYVTLNEAWIYIPTGLIGAVLGTIILKKISPKILKKIFACFMIYVGIRMVLK